ncbi:MAG: NAD(P)/FAD-dependent oxidoreductase [Anaerolineae bacterium]
MASKPKVVILGAGFGGLWAARRLAKEAVDILLIDKNNYHTFLPLLYQVAAAELEPERIAQPVRYLIRDQANLNFRMGAVTAITPADKTVSVDGEPIDYDYLILALGSTTAFFGVPGAEEHCFTLKSIDEAVQMRNHILSKIEAAANEPDPAKQRQMLTFAIVGGGATGVEYAGALAELIYQPLEKDYPRLDLKNLTRVILIEAGPQLLTGIDKDGYTVERLTKIGVDVRLNTRVESVEEDCVKIADSDPLLTDTVLWAAGIQGQPVVKSAGAELTRGSQFEVLETLQSQEYPEMFVVGDLIRFEQDGKPLINTAQVAMQSGETAAENVMALIGSNPLTNFRYYDKGMMATIGRNAAVANIGGRYFTGFFAWLIWLFIHLFFLIGFRNRLGVLTNWAWNYLFFERVVRLIMPLNAQKNS